MAEFPEAMRRPAEPYAASQTSRWLSLIPASAHLFLTCTTAADIPKRSARARHWSGLTKRGSGFYWVGIFTAAPGIQAAVN